MYAAESREPDQQRLAISSAGVAAAPTGTGVERGLLYISTAQRSRADLCYWCHGELADDSMLCLPSNRPGVFVAFCRHCAQAMGPTSGDRWIDARAARYMTCLLYTSDAAD